MQFGVRIDPACNLNPIPVSRKPDFFQFPGDRRLETDNARLTESLKVLSASSPEYKRCRLVG